MLSSLKFCIKIAPNCKCTLKIYLKNQDIFCYMLHVCALFQAGKSLLISTMLNVFCFIECFATHASCFESFKCWKSRIFYKLSLWRAMLSYVLMLNKLLYKKNKEGSSCFHICSELYFFILQDEILAIQIKSRLSLKSPSKWKVKKYFMYCNFTAVN